MRLIDLRCCFRRPQVTEHFLDPALADKVQNEADVQEHHLLQQEHGPLLALQLERDVSLVPLQHLALLQLQFLNELHVLVDLVAQLDLQLSALLRLHLLAHR